MKKRFFGFVLAFAFLLTGTICLTACGGEKKLYYTVSQSPAHTSVELYNGTKTDDKGKTYLLKGESFNIAINVESGFYSDNFKMVLNGEAVTFTTATMTNGIITNYEYSFYPKADFSITFEGEFKQIRAGLSFDTEEFYNASLYNETYIRFKPNGYALPTTEMTVSQFEVVSHSLNKTLNFGDTLEFYVYTKTFADCPAMFNTLNTMYSLDCEFYVDEGKSEYGVHYTYTQGAQDEILMIGSSWMPSFSFKVSENDFMGNNIVSDKLDFECRDGKLIFTLKDYANVPDEVLEALRLKINEEELSINFKTAENDNGKFVINLKNSYEYFTSESIDAMSAYNYSFDLNFYNFEYFDGLLFSPVE